MYRTRLKIKSRRQLALHLRSHYGLNSHDRMTIRRSLKKMERYQNMLSKILPVLNQVYNENLDK